jgi:hypothetical protein
MAVKLLMSWDILPGREQEYFEFVVREFIPAIQRLGLEPTDAWYTMYGNQPQIVAAAVMSTQQALEHVLQGKEWNDLTNRLLNFVENFATKVVPARRGFQL